MSMAAQRELHAAGIDEPVLQAGYLRARQLNAQHGKTYFLATLLLPAAKRPSVHALYGFARYADDIVDNLDPAVSVAERSAEFEAWSAAFRIDLRRGTSADPLCRAVIDTQRRWGIDEQHFVDFLQSMGMDLTVAQYESYADLAAYMWGSAAVIGLQMLPILGRADTGPPLERYAVDLGLAFQLTNFLRDVGEDLDRARVYLPQESLRRFDLSNADLVAARRHRSRIQAGISDGEGTGCMDERLRELIRFEIERARALYRSAEPGLDLVHPTSRDCLRTAWTLYSDILDAIVASDYDVFSRRVATSRSRRARVAVPGLVRAWRARRPAGRSPQPG
jgi:phytoene synthase